MRAPLVLKVHGFRKTWLREQHGGSGCTNACVSPWLMSHYVLVQHSRDNGADLNTLEHANYKLVERHATFGHNWWSIQTSTAMQISRWCSASSPRSTTSLSPQPSTKTDRVQFGSLPTSKSSVRVFSKEPLACTLQVRPQTNTSIYARAFATGFA